MRQDLISLIRENLLTIISKIASFNEDSTDFKKGSEYYGKNIGLLIKKITTIKL